MNAGDRQAFEEFAYPLLDSAYRTALRMTGQPATAEDARWSYQYILDALKQGKSVGDAGSAARASSCSMSIDSGVRPSRLYDVTKTAEPSTLTLAITTSPSLRPTASPIHSQPCTDVVC